MSRIENHAATARRELGITGYPRLPGLHALLDHLSERYRYVPTPGRPNGACWHRTADTGTIWADPCLAEVLGHELGHALLTVGLADWLLFHGEPGAKTQGYRDEAQAQAFGLAFLILLDGARDRTISNEDLAELAGVPVALVEDRRRPFSFRR